MRKYINDSWLYSPDFKDSYLEKINMDSFKRVRIPHSNKILDYNYIDNNAYQFVSSYYTVIDLNEFKDNLVFLGFDGVAHESTVYLNGRRALVHKCGYTKFKVLLNDFADSEGRVRVLLRVDSSESLNQPPFGYVIDYLTYGGVYRDTYLDIKNKIYIDDLFIDGDMSSNLTLRLKYSADYSNLRLHIKSSFLDKVVDAGERLIFKGLNVKLWSPDEPNLYEVNVKLIDNDRVVDEKIVNVGFRTISSKPDGIYLNGKKIFIRGLNRHQSYPYAGYAMPKRVEENDAKILKYELGLNAVRTSHYPQSEDFINECDKIGLLVFTEIPGWQHIGDDEWKNEAIKNTHDMIMDLKNHPSIFMWGVRINESADDHDFYTKTNEMARSLDSTRLIGGVRCFEGSELLEDVYTYNDFIHDGSNAGCHKKNKVMKDKKKPLLVTEYNGHMYPTKIFDDEIHRTEHLCRHYRVLNDIAKENNAGSFGWCMADYNTHKDFGSGDNICYHGVLDMFRNPKPAAYAYKSQSELSPVMEINTTLDIGEYPGGYLKNIMVMTNLDMIRLYKGSEAIGDFYPSKEYPSLKHPPVIIDDLVGNQIEVHEPYSKRTAAIIKKALLDIQKTGLNKMSLKTILRMLYLMLFKGMTIERGTELYEKYVGAWGDHQRAYTIVGIKDGKEVARKTIEPFKKINLKIESDTLELIEDKSYDVASVRIEAANQAGIHMQYFNEALRLDVSGDIELIGPSVISLKGGYGGFYIKSKNKGSGKVVVYYNDLPIKELSYKIK